MKDNLRMSQLTRGLLSIAIVSAGVATTTYHSDAVAAVSSGRHNLGSTGGANNNKTTSTNEVCVFCHTPHGADVSTAGAPLWNKKFTAGPFSQYVATSTLEGRFATDGVASSPFLSGASLACLSCHDGTQAVDNLLNSPGSGTIDSTGGGASGLNYTWTIGSNSTINASGLLQGAVVLGNALNNDHPIGIQYCGGGPVVTATGVACNDADFTAPSNAVVGGQTIFWVDTGTAGRQRTDMQLYNRNFPVAGLGPSVECASCHDVHSANALFLRISNASSAVCLACHTK